MRQGLNNNIHPTAVIDDSVIIGNGNTIAPYAVITGDTVIGDNNYIGPHTAIGVPATDTKHVDFGYEHPHVEIGNNNIIREFCVVEQPCYEAISVIGNDVFLMQGVHMSHDNILKDRVVVTNQCVIGGVAKILDGADLGMGCTINQYSIVGQYCIVATGAPCMKNVKPFSRYIPNRPISVNTYALKKYGFMDYIEEITAYVMGGTMPETPHLNAIVKEFDEWVYKYGHETYK